VIIIIIRPITELFNNAVSD